MNAYSRNERKSTKNSLIEYDVANDDWSIKKDLKLGNSHSQIMTFVQPSTVGCG